MENVNKKRSILLLIGWTKYPTHYFSCPADVNSEYVLTPEDKANEGLVIISQKYLMEPLINEIDLNDLPSNKTNLNHNDLQENDHCAVAWKFASTISNFKLDQSKNYPSYIGWLPKLHKTPLKIEIWETYLRSFDLLESIFSGIVWIDELPNLDDACNLFP